MRRRERRPLSTATGDEAGRLAVDDVLWRVGDRDDAAGAPAEVAHGWQQGRLLGARRGGEDVREARGEGEAVELALERGAVAPLGDEHGAPAADAIEHGAGAGKTRSSARWRASSSNGRRASAYASASAADRPQPRATSLLGRLVALLRPVRRVGAAAARADQLGVDAAVARLDVDQRAVEVEDPEARAFSSRPMRAARRACSASTSAIVVRRGRQSMPRIQASPSGSG